LFLHVLPSRLSKVLAAVRSGGGTNLSLGIQAGFDELRSLEHPSLLSRAIFLTDMESGPDDEARVIKGGIRKLSSKSVMNESPNS
jgi:hypothetical protein